MTTARCGACKWPTCRAAQTSDTIEDASSSRSDYECFMVFVSDQTSLDTNGDVKQTELQPLVFSMFALSIIAPGQILFYVFLSNVASL